MTTTRTSRGLALFQAMAFAWAGATIHSDAFAQSPGTSLACDDSIKAAFRPDELTTVILVKQYKRGDPIVLSEPRSDYTPIAETDLCLVKLNVGPGNPGPSGAPSTSPGIGIEIWLPPPRVWDGRIHAIGGGGYVGGSHGSPAAIGEPRAASVAGSEGTVSSSSDAGHPRPGAVPGRASSGGDFAMNPDGTLNQVLLRDFASRSVHEQAVKTKALATLYYGKPPRFSYWDGSSQGGRQALSLAQNHPEDFDGIIANMPAINWSEGVGNMFAQIVFQRDLGGVAPTDAQSDLVSNAAIRACDIVGGQHLGFILDIAACRYDPTKDLAVLCHADGGHNTTSDCVSSKLATAFNKIWYGMTSDGSVPSPATDNGWDRPLGGARRWYGLPRGTSLYNAHFSRFFGVNAGIASAKGAYTSSSDRLALILLDPRMASTNFENATGNGIDLWKSLTYAQLSSTLDRGLKLQPELGHIDTNNPDLSAFQARGGKMLSWHGIHDEVIPVQSTIRYYGSVVAKMGGLANVQSFYRLYVVPGMGHASPNGTSNPEANVPNLDRDQFYKLLVAWVEQGTVPGRVELHSPSTAQPRRNQPICPFPQKASFIGGDPNHTTSFACR